MLDTLSQLPHAGGPPRTLVVMLHGVGSNKEDLIGLAPYLGPALPHTAFVSVDGVEECDMAPMGRQWFSLSDRAPARMMSEAARTACRRSMCSDTSPCDRFSLTTSTPARMRRSSISGDALAGPSVATIFVLDSMTSIQAC